MPHSDFIHVQYAEPHLSRAKQILKAHPEVRQLFGNTPSTALWIVGAVGLNVLAAVLLRDSSYAWILFWSYLVGAILNHALFALIHDCAHNLVFKGTRANQAIGIVANLPIVFPSAIAFKRFHLVHHRHQGELAMDADLAGPAEARWVGDSAFRKAVWLLFFFVVEGFIRPRRVKSVKFVDGWTIANVVVELAFLAALTAAAGPKSLLYLFLSTIFSIGLHPVGARWIQEHYVFREGQETYSYYGPMNRLCFNVGYHNEHHDLMMVPWSRLPRLKAMAPEFYDSLQSHSSWSQLLLRFLFDRKVTLYSRAVRPDRHAQPSSAQTSGLQETLPAEA